MDKVEFLNNAASFLNPLFLNNKNEAKKTKDNTKGLRFSSILQRVSSFDQGDAVKEIDGESSVSEETVKELLDEIHIAGDVLRSRPLPEEILRYKKAVKNFLNYVVKNGYATEVQMRYIKKERRTQTLVKIVDTKLEQLAAGILAGQIVQLEILKRLEEIKGILIDLTIEGSIIAG